MSNEHRRLVCVKELRTEYGIPLSYTQLKRKMYEDAPPTFPLCVKLGKHPTSRVAWYADEISDYVTTLASTR